MQKLIFIHANISDFNVYERDLQATEKHFISAQQLLENSFKLAWKIYQSGYRPNYIDRKNGFYRKVLNKLH
jgi:hypothetical protein